MHHRNLHSPTKLTEFARDFDSEEPDSFIGKFVSRLTSAYNSGYNTVNGAPATGAPLVPAPGGLHRPTPVRATSTATAAAADNRSSDRVESAGGPSSNSSSSSSSNTPRPSAERSGSSGSAQNVGAATPSSSGHSISADDLSAADRTSLASTTSSTLQTAASVRPSPTTTSGGGGDRLASGVISRIGNLMAHKSDNLTSYKDTELQRFWMPDAKSKECYECQLKFTTFRRRHHCRLCGQIFCSRCCCQVVPGKIIGCSGDLKVCTYCSKIVLSYLRSADINSDLRSDLQALQADLEQGGGGRLGAMDASISADALLHPSSGRSAGADHLLAQQRKVSLGYQEERLAAVQSQFGRSAAASAADRRAALQQSQSLRALHAQMSAALPYQRTGGADLVRYVRYSTQLAASDGQAVAILSAMLEAGFLLATEEAARLQMDAGRSPSTTSTAMALASSDDDGLLAELEQPEFTEQHAYKLAPVDDDVMTQSASSSLFQLDVDVDASAVHLSRTAVAAAAAMTNDDGEDKEALERAGSGGEQEQHGLEVSFGFTASKDAEMHNSMLSTAGSKPLMEAFCEHEELLLAQLLATAAIPTAWAKPLLQLCAETVNAIDPAQCGMMPLEQPRRSMDIRHYVSFKKVPGGQRHDSRICAGVAFTKDVVHKAMLARIDQPRVLLLRCAIVYQRIEGRFVSIDTLLLQEREYLHNVTQRILALRPHVVLVHRNVSGIAQDMLRQQGITLVLDVKLTVLERLARALQCDIVESIDSNVGRPKLGTCERFVTRTFECASSATTKTLMFFELPSVQRGCCVLLRGAPEAELVRVKRVARMLLYARYNWRLELALLLDEFARPPSPKASLFESKDHSPVKEEEEEEGGEEDGERTKVEARDGDVEQQGVQDDEQTAGNSDRSRSSVPSTVDPAVDSTSTANPKPTTSCPTNHGPDRIRVTKEHVPDFSDPLRAFDVSPGAFAHADSDSAVQFAVQSPCDNRFRAALSSTVLSVSPFVSFALPYLETETGRKCALRSRFPAELYYSPQLAERSQPDGTEPDPGGAPSGRSNRIAFGQPHEFLSHRITTSMRSREMQALWANFRASGGRLPHTMQMRRIPDATAQMSSPTTTDQDDAGVPNKPPPRIDALSIDNHQRLPVLFCSFHAPAPKPALAFCTPPALLRMTFYGEQDIMLGQFLEHYCFRRSYTCHSCTLPMLGHVRRYVHAMGCVQLKLVEDQSTVNSEHILMTSWCQRCHAWTPSVPLAVDTWCLSFAKYLELRFHGHAYRKRTVEAGAEPCTHSMHRDHVHYFSFNGIVASFVYVPLTSWSLALPASVRQLKPTRGDAAADGSAQRKQQHLDEVRLFGQTGYEVYARVYDRLAAVASDAETMPPALAALKQQLNRDQLAFRDRIAGVQLLLTADGAAADGGGGGWEVQDALWAVKRALAESCEVWTQRLTEAAQVADRASSSTSSASQQQQQRSAQRPDSAGSIDAGTICTEDLCPDSPVMAAAAAAGDAADVPVPDFQQQRRTSDQLEPAEAVGSSPTKQPASIAPPAGSHQTDGLTPATQHLHAADKKSVKTILRDLLPSDKPSANCIQSPLASGEHYCLSTGGLIPVTVHDQDPSSVIAFALVSHDYKKALDVRQQQLQQQAQEAVGAGAVAEVAGASMAAASMPVPAYATQSSSTSSTSLGMQAGASPQLIGPRKSNDGSLDGDAELREPQEKKRSSAAAAHIEVAFSDSTTSFTCKTYFAHEFDTLRASLISTGIGGSGHSPNASPNKAYEATSATPTTAGESNADQSTATIGGGGSTSESEHKRKVSNTLPAVPQSVQSSADDVDEVRVLFARSLCSSVMWDARGGKSGSKFCKTKDDRFVLKEMSRVDMMIFENFAPKYFEYVAQCMQRNEPTLLAKIFGVYRLTIKKKDSVLEKSLLVMENLFYNSDITTIYDLKGSDRNRLVNPKEYKGEHVLLDENLIMNSWQHPLYILRHSQTVMLEALQRDTAFLERNDVMDYSLLAGLNGTEKILVLGIIDYIRTFTLDKRIESIVKKSGILGGQGKLPTVISPKQYRQRFLEAMQRYFLPVPDRWEGLAQTGMP